MRESKFKTTKELAMELLSFPEDTILKFAIFQDGKLTLRCDEGVEVFYYNNCPNNVIVLRIDAVEQPNYGS